MTDRSSQTPPPRSHADPQPRRIAKAAALSAVVTVMGAILLVSPVTSAIVGQLEAGGLVRAGAIIFGIWAGLVAISFVLARLLADELPED